MFNIHQLAQKLNSSRISERNIANQYFLQMRDKLEIEDFIENYREIYQLLIINLLIDILNELETDHSTWALDLLLSFVEADNSVATKIASGAIEDFFASNDVLFHFKSYILSQCIREKNDYQRLFLTQIVRKNKLLGLSKVLMQNFSTKNQRLIIETICTFAEFNDRRGLRVIRAHVTNENTAIACEAIKALGALGDISDVLLLLKMSGHSNRNYKFAAIEALRLNLGKLAYYLLYSLYKKEKDLDVKIHLLEAIAKNNKKKAASLIIDELTRYENPVIEEKLTKALRACNDSQKDSFLWRKLSAFGVEKFLRNYDSITSVDNLLLRKIMTFIKSDGELICRLAMTDHLRKFPTINVLKELEALYKTTNGALQQQAFNSICSIHFSLSPRQVNLAPPSEQSLECDVHIIYAKYLYKVGRHNFAGNQIISQYLYQLLDSLNFDVVCASLNTFRYYYSKQDCLDLIKFYNNTTRDELKPILLTSLRSILYNARDITPLIFEQFPVEVFVELDIERINDRLLAIIMESISTQTEHTLFDFLRNNLISLNPRVSNLLVKLDHEDFLRQASVFVKLGYTFSNDVHKRLKKYGRKDAMLSLELARYFLKLKRKNDLNFILKNFDVAISKNLHVELKQYLRAVL